MIHRQRNDPKVMNTLRGVGFSNSSRNCLGMATRRFASTTRGKIPAQGIYHHRPPPIATIATRYPEIYECQQDCENFFEDSCCRRRKWPTHARLWTESFCEATRFNALESRKAVGTGRPSWRVRIRRARVPGRA